MRAPKPSCSLGYESTPIIPSNGCQPDRHGSNDDDDQRHQAVEAFFARRSDFAVDHVHTARRAIRALDSRRYFLVCLDHDLERSHEKLVGVPYESGQVVADHLATMPERRLPAWVHIHSHNELCRENMAATLVNGAPSVKVTVAKFALTRAYWARVAILAKQWSQHP